MNRDIISNAESYRSKLFGNTDSALAYTDPEFVQIFENFAFGDVVESSKLDDRTRMMAVLAALIGAQGADAFRTMLPGALQIGVEPEAVKEIVYQATPYLGLSRMLPYLLIVNEALRNRSVKLPLEKHKTTTRPEHLKKGNDIQVEIFGPQMRDSWTEGAEDMEHIRKWLASNCFGDYFTRDGLELREREMVAFCFLVALGGCDEQVKAQVKGNMNVGNDREFLIDVVSQVIPYIGFPRCMNALRAIDEASK